MNTDLTKEQLDELENDLNYHTSDDPRVTRLISMARRTLQAEERLGRAVEALKFYADEDNYRSISIRFAHEVDLDCGNKARSVLLSLDSPKDLPPPLPCAPPAHSDAQPDSVSRLVADIAQEFNDELECWKAACSRLEKHVHRLTNECLELRSLTLNPESP